MGKKQEDEPNKNKPGPVPTLVTIVTTSTTTQKTEVETKDPMEDLSTDPSVIVHDNPGPKAEPSNNQDDSGTLSGVAIGFSVVLVLAIAVGGLFLFRKVQSNRYRS